MWELLSTQTFSRTPPLFFASKKASRMLLEDGERVDHMI